jgi:hypothetical protein
MSFIDFAELARARAQADVLFDLGMKYANGCAGDLDLVAAHKWFNLAAMRGNREAVRYRGEIASEMSEAEIAAAQRAARTWLQEIGRFPIEIAKEFA